MKKLNYYLIIVLAFGCFSQNAFSQKWSQPITYTYTDIIDICFPTSEVGYIASDSMLNKTTDGGESWAKITSLEIPAKSYITAMYFIDSDTGYVAYEADSAGANLKFSKTDNGGSSWTVITLPDPLEDAEIVSIHFVDSQTGWVLSSSTSEAKVQFTTNGGSTWGTVLTNAGALFSMNFYDNTFKGTVVGGGKGKLDLYYTKNGLDWTKAPAPVMSPVYTKTEIRTVIMVDSLNVHAAGWGLLTGAQPTIHLKSTDGGASWEYMTQSAENILYDNINDMYFKDADNGLAVGGGVKGGSIVRTTDGGVNWIPLNIPSGPTLLRIDGVGDKIIAGGQTGVMLTSENFGGNWLLTKNFPYTAFNVVQAVSDDVIYVGGNDALLLKSTDGGDSWENSYIRAGNISTNITGLFFVNENTGYAGHSYGMVTKTTDGGQSWSKVIPDTAASVAYNDLYFLDENNGYAVGKWASSKDVIQKTTDGGQNWKRTTLQSNTVLKSVAFSDASRGIVVGDKQSSLYTTDGGANWTASAFHDVPAELTTPSVNQVAFTNGLNAVAAGYRMFLHSTDGGANWNYVSNVDTTANITGLTFKDSLNGWAVASSPLTNSSMGIFTTKDGGRSWRYGKDTITISGSMTRNSISVTPSGKLFAVTLYSGLFILNTADTTIGIDDDNFEMPSSYNLAQNYPNPFNPETTIRFTLPAQERVTLKVYDILGKEVAELANETMNAGTHSIRFSSHSYNLASGVYFYVLRADNFSQTKKMILLK